MVNTVHFDKAAQVIDEGRSKSQSRLKIHSDINDETKDLLSERRDRHEALNDSQDDGQDEEAARRGRATAGTSVSLEPHPISKRTPTDENVEQPTSEPKQPVSRRSSQTSQRIVHRPHLKSQSQPSPTSERTSIFGISWNRDKPVLAEVRDDISEKEHRGKDMEGRKPRKTDRVKKLEAQCTMLMEEVENLSGTLRERNLQIAAIQNRHFEGLVVAAPPTSEIETMRDRIIKLEEDNAIKDRRVQELENCLKSKDSQIAAIQNQHFQAFKGAGIGRIEDDEVIRKKIRRCMSDWRAWANRYSIKDFASQDSARKSMTLELLRRHSVFEQDGSKDRWTMQDLSRILRPLLNAALATHITESILEHPFFCLEGFPIGESNNIATAFTTVYNHLCQDDESQANTWRWRTLKLLDAHEPRAEAETSRGTVERHKALYYQKVAREFETKAAYPLLRAGDADWTRTRFDELYKIIYDVGQLFSMLRNHKIAIKVLGKEAFAGRAFRPDIAPVVPHVSQEVDDDEEGLSLRGRHIQMVVSPAIIAFEYKDETNIEEINYDQPKEWAKAIAWLSDPSPSQRQVTTAPR